MNDLDGREIRELPTSMLLDPIGNRAAAYNAIHRVVTFDASPALVAFAKASPLRSLKFDPELHAKGLPDWRPLPPWATEEVQARMRLVYVRSGAETLEELRKLPTR